ncbi:MAG: lipopolysaccharide transport periplasmic protein LptA [Alphaproteobacteria bacterium]
MKAPVVFLAVLWPAAALAQAADTAATPVTPFKTDTSKPITVTSDTLSADIDANIGIYSGNVVITQDTLKMRADEVKVIAAEGKPSRLEARGKIVFDSPSGSAMGEFATYDVNSKLVTLTGRDVVLTKDQNVMHGTRLDVNLNTNQAKLYSVGQFNNRVQGLFVPNSGTKSEGSRKKSNPKKPASPPAGG